MASLLFDSILNETIQNFRGHELLENSLAAPVNSDIPSSSATNPQNLSSTSTLGQPIDPNADQAFDQIDKLTSLDLEPRLGQNERLFWILLFSFMVLVAAGGNIIVIYIVSTNKEMKSVTNYFLVNLSLADTMVSTLNVIFNFISMLNR